MGPVPDASEPCGETDPRFPSGEWIGFFLQPAIPPGKHWMNLHLNFRSGRVDGAGHDWIGPFLIVGTYTLEDGNCQLRKEYLGRHVVFYRGFNEGRGIWGVWEIPALFQGGFHIWPKQMPPPDSGGQRRYEEVPAAAAEEILVTSGQVSDA